MASLQPKPGCDELRQEEADELCEIFNCMVEVMQDGPRAGEVTIEGFCQTMLQQFFGMGSSNPAWRAKEAWDFLLKKPIPLSNGRCVICVVKEVDPKTGTPCKVEYVTLCEDDDEECPNRYCGWDYVALAKAVSEMYAWFQFSGQAGGGTPPATMQCPVRLFTGFERIKLGSGPQAMWHPLYAELSLDDKAKLDKCGPCFDPEFCPEGWDCIVDPDTGEACFFTHTPTYEWKEQYIETTLEELQGENCPDLCPGQTVIIDCMAYPVFKKEDGTVAVDLTGLPPDPPADGVPLGAPEFLYTPECDVVKAVTLFKEADCSITCKYFMLDGTSWTGDPKTLLPDKPIEVEPEEPTKVPITSDDPEKPFGPNCYPLTYMGTVYDTQAAFEAALSSDDCPVTIVEGQACYPPGCEAPGEIIVTCNPDDVQKCTYEMKTLTETSLATCFAEGRAVAWTAPFDVATGPDVFHADQAALEAAITAAYPGFTATIDLTPDGSIFPELCLTGEGECPEGPFLYDCENPGNEENCNYVTVDCRIADFVEAIPPVEPNHNCKTWAVTGGGIGGPPQSLPYGDGNVWNPVLDTTDIVGIVVNVNDNSGAGVTMDACYQGPNGPTTVPGPPNGYMQDAAGDIRFPFDFDEKTLVDGTPCPPCIEDQLPADAMIGGATNGSLGLQLLLWTGAEVTSITCYKKVPIK